MVERTDRQRTGYGRGIANGAMAMKKFPKRQVTDLMVGILEKTVKETELIPFKIFLIDIQEK